MLEYEPELEETLRARYSAALTPIYDMKRVYSGKQSPAEHRKHVFDFFDGTRIVAFKEKDKHFVVTHYAITMNNPMKFECMGELVAYMAHHINSLRKLPIIDEIDIFIENDVFHFMVPDSNNAILN
jgi:hypothetical protein